MGDNTRKDEKEGIRMLEFDSLLSNNIAWSSY